MGSIPTPLRVFMCPCVGPFPSLGLTLGRDKVGISLSLQLTPRNDFDHFLPYSETFRSVYCSGGFDINNNDNRNNGIFYGLAKREYTANVPKDGTGKHRNTFQELQNSLTVAK